MEKRVFGTLTDGAEVLVYSFTNKNNVTMEVSDFGATWVGMLVPDKDGVQRDVVLGYDTPQGYIENFGNYFGGLIGRSANRIEGASFRINGQSYQMPVNENGNNLHSGPDGYQLRKWDVKAIDEEKNSITFSLLSPDGDQGFPGNFQVSVTYTLTETNEMVARYEGISDADTVANLTQHVYFNLGGHDSGSILDQQLMIAADGYTPVRDSKSIPTGEIAPVAGTPMDFTTAKPIGRDIEADFEQLKLTGGYDHNYVLAAEAGTMRKMAEAYCEATGIAMDAFTDRCGVQFYAGNFIKEHTAKKGATYYYRQGFCLESQFYPNAINQEGFASPLLKAGEKYDTVTSYKFYVK